MWPLTEPKPSQSWFLFGWYRYIGQDREAWQESHYKSLGWTFYFSQAERLLSLGWLEREEVIGRCFWYPVEKVFGGNGPCYYFSYFLSDQRRKATSQPQNGWMSKSRAETCLQFFLSWSSFPLQIGHTHLHLYHVIDAPTSIPCLKGNCADFLNFKTFLSFFTYLVHVTVLNLLFNTFQQKTYDPYCTLLSFSWGLFLIFAKPVNIFMIRHLYFCKIFFQDT